MTPGNFAAAALGRLAGQTLRREGDTHIMHYCILHSDLQPMAFAGLTPFVERAKDSYRHNHSGSGITN